MTSEVFFPIEGRQDCQHYTGFVGVILHHGQTFGVMHCAWHEYQNAVCGATSEIGGIITERCKGCRHYQSKEAS